MEELTKACVICNKNEFENRDGYFFCLECGTQVEHLLETAVEGDYVQDNHLVSKKKIKSTKLNQQDDLEITSWECVNYILVGLVGELNSLGAKDELKLKTFQLWAEFLRKNEVAFFRSKANPFPKLSCFYKPSDAKAVFNHQTRKRKRKKSEGSSANGSITWRKQKRKYASSEYEKSLTESDFSLVTLLNSSLSSSEVSSKRGIKINLKDSARRIIKKKNIRSKHLERHENDYNNEMDCQCIPLKKEIVIYSKRTSELFNRKTVFAILSIALNLIDDDIQISDLIRFMQRGHISSKKFSHFFPENIRKKCVKIYSKDFPRDFNLSAASIRRQAAVVCKFLSIKRLNTPNLVHMVTRYCKDFLLPSEISLYIERLICFFPPQMEYISDVTPFFEGRALAYIIFILKLLFGLDDVREELISDSAKQVNKILENLGRKRKLFVFTDWLESIELRKMILSRYNLCYFKSNKDFKNPQSNLEMLESESPEQYEGEDKCDRANVKNMNQIFETFLEDFKREQPSSDMKFISFTPQLDYFERIIYDPPADINLNLVPENLKFDHSSSEIKSFLNPKKLKKRLKQKNINLNVCKLEINQKVNYVDTFSINNNKPKENQMMFREINFSESKSDDTSEYSKLFDINFLKPVTKDKLKSRPKNSEKESNSSYKNKVNKYITKLKSQQSGETGKDIFSDLSDGELSSCEGDTGNESENLKFAISNMEYGILHGKLDIKEEDFKNVQKHMPRNFLWLLETFSEYLEVELEFLYKELIIIENQYFYKLEDVDKIKSVILFKDINTQEKCAKYADFFAKFW